MEARLYELIRDYQEHRSQADGNAVRDFRFHQLLYFARAHPELYPEYVAEDERLNLAVAKARAAGEIVPLKSGDRDHRLMLRVDRDRAI